MSRVPQPPVRRPQPQLARPRPAPAVDLVEPAPRPVKANLPARPATVPPPQVTEEQFDVPTLIADIESGLRSLKGNAAGFAALNRAADDAKQEPPIVSWAANFNSTPVEVQTDLAALADEDREPVLTAMINIHGVQLMEAARKIQAASTALVKSLGESIAEPGDDASVGNEGQEPGDVQDEGDQQQE